MRRNVYGIGLHLRSRLVKILQFPCLHYSDLSHFILIGGQHE
jgi:hypothetical protein